MELCIGTSAAAVHVTIAADFAILLAHGHYCACSRFTVSSCLDVDRQLINPLLRA